VQIVNIDRPPDVPDQLTLLMRDVVTKCFCLDPMHRPSAKELLELEVFTRLDNGVGSSQEESETVNITDVSFSMASLYM